MVKTYRYFIAFLIIAFCVVSCVEDFGSDNKAVASTDFVILASIESDSDTKISYSAQSGKLKQTWAKGDKIVGYSVVNHNVTDYTFDFKEYKTGKAVFSYSGKTPPANGTKLYMMYAPGYDSFNNNLVVDIVSQKQDELPAFMFASGTVDNQKLELTFRNEMALIAVVNPTFDYLSGDTLKNVRIKGDNVTTYGLWNVSSDSLDFTPIKWHDYIDASCSLLIDDKGNTNGTIYISLFPNATSADIDFTLTTSAKTYEFTVKGKTIEAGKCYTITPAFAETIPDGALPGSFSVSETTKVHFSQGNLKYNVSSKQWGFFNKQWDYDHGTPDQTFSGVLNASSNDISLFTWGYNATISVDPTGNTAGVGGLALSSGNLSSSQDWGCAVGDGKTWRTLTFQEWQYLLSRTRGDGKSSAIFADVPVTDSTSVHGIILMPDEWDGSPMLSVANVTRAEWKELVFKGAVLLPAASYRDREELEVDPTIPHCCYWTASTNSSVSAYCLHFYSNSLTLDSSSSASRDYGYSVRLVTDVK